MTRKPSPSSATKPAAAQKRKPRHRVRTKTCAKCFTPCTTITRCRIQANRGSTYICDICWPTYCVDNPSYVYEGTWQSGRIVEKI